MFPVHDLKIFVILLFVHDFSRAQMIVPFYSMNKTRLHYSSSCVDDMIIHANDKSSTSALKTYFMSHFKMEDKGSLTYHLELEFSHTNAQH